MRVSRVRAASAAFGAAAIGGAVGSVLDAGCLPDLGHSVSLLDAGDGASRRTCGDGLIDLDAGETCEPSPDDPGTCSSDCHVACDGGFLDPATQHCYVALSSPMRFDVASATCEAAGGHIVALGSEGELGRIARADVLLSPGGNRGVWAGLYTEDDGGSYRSVADVPGWAPGGKCPGCFAVTTPDGGLVAFSRSFPKRRDGGAPDSGGGCVAFGGDPTAPGHLDPSAPWLRTACDARDVQVLCEREPSGTSSGPCDGGACLRVQVAATAPKRYLYSPARVSADDAARACRRMGGRLVVFESADEREAVVRELSRITAVDVRGEFWMGLSRHAGDPISEWTWEDGNKLGALYPVPWGDSQPRATGTARAYLVRGTGYDTGLAAADDGVVSLPYLCEY